MYSYKECEDVTLEYKEREQEEKKEENRTELKQEQLITGQIVREQEIVEELEKSVGTKKAKKDNGSLIILFIILGLCITGTLYIILKRNFNKESNW